MVQAIGPVPVWMAVLDPMQCAANSFSCLVEAVSMAQLLVKQQGMVKLCGVYWNVVQVCFIRIDCGFCLQEWMHCLKLGYSAGQNTLVPFLKVKIVLRMRLALIVPVQVHLMIEIVLTADWQDTAVNIR